MEPLVDPTSVERLGIVGILVLWGSTTAAAFIRKWVVLGAAHRELTEHLLQQLAYEREERAQERAELVARNEQLFQLVVDSKGLAVEAVETVKRVLPPRDRR